MRSTSFGKMDEILNVDNKLVAEYLVFEKEGRKHKHPVYESFTVISGKGVVVVGEERVSVRPGSIVTIPPKTDHWMIPAQNEVLTGMLWYHEEAATHQMPDQLSEPGIQSPRA